MQNGEFELPEGSYSVSDIQDYFDHKKHETSTTNLPIHAPMQNDKFVLPGVSYSVSDIQNYIE